MTPIKNATSILDYIFRELAVSYLQRHDLAHVDTSDFGNTALGKGISEGKAQPFSKGLTRGASLKVVTSAGAAANAEPKGQAGSAPASGASVITASFSGKASGNLAVKSEPAAPDIEGATAFKRDYEERAEELAAEIEIEETLFSDEAAEDAANAKADAKKLEADRRARSIMQGYTGNMCSECQNFTMVRNGTCEKCDTCGATSGCS
jgi:ribonucleoside-diphosphate reductase alpha chain